jgi:hypothetical protein
MQGLADPVSDTRTSPRRNGRRAALVVFSLLTVVPLYILLIAIVIRSEIFAFGGDPLTDAQFKGLWAFVGVISTTCAITLGTLITKSHNDRTLALAQDTETRTSLTVRETNERQKLETAVACLALISKDGTYASRASIAGGLAALVQLGHPIIAIRALVSALKDEVVDTETLTWLIGQVLTTEYTVGTAADLAAAKEEAAKLLYICARTLPSDESDGEYSWPDAVTAQWPRNLSRNAALNLVYGLVELLLARPKDWWTTNGYTYTWVIYTLDEAVRHEANEQPRRLAANIGLLLLEMTPDKCRVSGIRDSRPQEDVHQHMVTAGGRIDDLNSTIADRIRLWARGEAFDGVPATTQGLPVENHLLPPVVQPYPPASQN